MLKKIKSYASVVWQLIIADLTAYSSSRYINELIDSFFWTATTLVVSGKLLSSFGMKPGFGIFVATGVPVSRCLFQIYPRATAIIIDLMSNKAITYDLSLPIPSWLAIFRIALSSFVRSMLLSIPALPFGLIFTWDEFNFATFSFFKFSLILCLSGILCSVFGLIIASMVTNTDELSSTWNRIIFPMWLLGGFQFSWATVNLKVPWLGFVSLFNPIIYAMEGMRAATLGQEGYISFWLCVGVLTAFSIIFGYVGVRRMLKRLDSV